jgi:ATP-dependent DNA helicase RecG
MSDRRIGGMIMEFIESSNVELKEVYVVDIKKEVVAFANTKGGIIYIGIADNGSVVGLEYPDEVMLQAGNAIRDAIKPDITLFVDYIIETIESKKVIKISVQRGVDRPYYLAEKGLKPSGVYVRQGSSSVPASEDAIRQMIKETDGDTYEKVRSFNQDLTFEYAANEMNKHNFEFTQVQMTTLGLVGDDGLYTNLGLLFSDQCVHSIKIAYFEGSDKSTFKDRREFHGSLLKQLSDAYEYIDLSNKTNATFRGLERIDVRDYPPEAIREALLNSIVHREYSFSGSTLINIYDDRIEFISLGGLVPGLSIEAIMLGVSQSRNEKLANFFYRLKLIEAYGTGIAKIISSYKESKIQPVIKATDGAFQVVLPNLNYSAHNDIKNKINSKTLITNLSNPQFQAVLNVVADKGSITRNETQNILGVGQSRALKVLNEMVEAKLIVPIGKGKNTEYQVK